PLGRQDPGMERVAHAVGEPRGKRAEAPAEDDSLEIEEVHGARECRAEGRTNLRKLAVHHRVTVDGPPDELGGDALHSPARVDLAAARLRDHLLPDHRLQAATASAGAELAA